MCIACGPEIMTVALQVGEAVAYGRALHREAGLAGSLLAVLGFTPDTDTTTAQEAETC